MSNESEACSTPEMWLRNQRRSVGEKLARGRATADAGPQASRESPPHTPSAHPPTSHVASDEERPRSESHQEQGHVWEPGTLGAHSRATPDLGQSHGHLLPFRRPVASVKPGKNAVSLHYRFPFLDPLYLLREYLRNRCGFSCRRNNSYMCAQAHTSH